MIKGIPWPAVQQAAKLFLLVFGILLVWQGVVFVTGAYPDHITPVVRLVCRCLKTGHVVPYAYQWTAILGVLSALGFVASGLLFLLSRFAANINRQ